MESKALVPLPAEYDSPAKLPEVTMWGMKISPPSTQVKMILDFYGIKNTVIEHKKKNDPYVFVPVLMVGEI